MTQQPLKKRETKEEVKIDEEFKRVAEKILRKDRDLLQRLAKI